MALSSECRVLLTIFAEYVQFYCFTLTSCVLEETIMFLIEDITIKAYGATVVISEKCQLLVFVNSAFMKKFIYFLFGHNNHSKWCSMQKFWSL